MEPLAQRLESKRHQRRRHQREREIRLAACADQRADTHDDAHVQRTDEHTQSAVDEGFVDDQVDVVQAVFQYSHAEREQESVENQEVRQCHNLLPLMRS